MRKAAFPPPSIARLAEHIEVDYALEEHAAIYIAFRLHRTVESCQKFLKARRVNHDYDTIFWMSFRGKCYFKRADVERFVRREQARARAILRKMAI